MVLAGITSTTDAMSVTTESMDMVSLSMIDSSNANGDDEEGHGTIGQMAKLLTEPNTMTTVASISTSTSTFDQINEASTIAIGESDSENDESSTIATTGKSDTILDVTKNSVQDTDRMPISLFVDDKSHGGETTMPNLNVNDKTNGAAAAVATTTTTTTTEADVDTDPQGETKPPFKISMIPSSSPTKVNDRSRVVSKNDIESIRGRALNLTGNERRQSMPGGVIYVTAPPPPPLSHSPSFDASANVAVNGLAMAMPKSAKAKTFDDDLSDVSMDNDDHVEMMKTMMTKAAPMKATTTTTTSKPTTHNPQCQSKVRFSSLLKTNISKDFNGEKNFFKWKSLPVI